MSLEYYFFGTQCIRSLAHSWVPRITNSPMLLAYISQGRRFSKGKKQLWHPWWQLLGHRWNLLPDNLRRTPAINSFKRKLKTHLFISSLFFVDFIFIFLLRILTFVLHQYSYCCNPRTINMIRYMCLKQQTNEPTDGHCHCIKPRGNVITRTMQITYMPTFGNQK